MTAAVTPDCAEIQERLSAFVDGELDDAAASAVRDHLESCAGCAAVARELRMVADGLAALPAPLPPDDLWARITARLDDADAPTPLRPRSDAAASSRRRVGWALPAALAVAAAAAAVLVTVRPFGAPRAPAGSGGALLAPAADGTRSRVPEGLVLVGQLADDLAPRDVDRLPDHVLLADAVREFGVAEEHYQRAATRMLALLERDRAARPFSPALATAFDRNLKTIDDAIARCRDLARAAPDDPWAHDVLYAAYGRKLRFLEDVLRSRAGEVAP